MGEFTVSYAGQDLSGSCKVFEVWDHALFVSVSISSARLSFLGFLKHLVLCSIEGVELTRC